jgi:CheY-like chemotaxis protein
MMQADLAAEQESLPAETGEMLHEIRNSAERAAKLTKQLLAFSRRQVLQTRLLDLNDVVTSLAKMLQRIVGEHVSMFLILHPTPLMVRVDSGMIDQVLLNLVINARDASPSGGQLVIRTGEVNVSPTDAAMNSDIRTGWHAFLSVSDTGCGIPTENLGRIFEPFFTTKEHGKGTGLGLSTVFGIARQHGGAVTVESQVAFGSTFRVLLPRSDEAPVVPSRDTARAAPRGGRETILLVEDDPAVRDLTRKVLEKAGYNVPEASRGTDALRVWRELNGDVDLLFTDIVMPDGLNGWELASRLQSFKPSLKIIFTSGHSEDVAGRQLDLKVGQTFIQKPSPPSALLEAVRRLLDT